MGISFIFPQQRGLLWEINSRWVSGATATARNILALESIPEGTTICNIEKNSGDGGKLIKSAGSSALVFSHGVEGVTIKFPSGKFLTVNPKCRAMIGIIAGAGRKEKPFLKAGTDTSICRLMEGYIQQLEV